MADPACRTGRPPCRVSYALTVDPRQLEYFLAVVEASSSKRAAGRPHVTQPSLSWGD